MGPPLDPLAADIEADVLVIGGGIAGMSTTLHLAEAGVDTVLVEARNPGSGATGQSGGLVAPDFIRHTPDTIGNVLGREAGERLTRMIGSSAATTFGLVERHGISCDAQQRGFYTPAHTEALAAEQRRYAAQWQSRGFSVEFVEAKEARDAFGAEGYTGALRFSEGGSLNPLGYVRGLARAATTHGARLFAKSPVTDLSRSDGRWTAVTPAGRILAKRLVLAANGGNASLHPALRRTALPLQVVQFSTAPLSPEERAHILPDGAAFTDKVPYLFTARLDGQGHLISAFPVSFLVRGGDGYLREAQRRLRRQFTTLPNAAISHIWEGVAWLNSSLLPEIYDLGEEAIAIQADNGRGLAANTALGGEVAAMLATGDVDALSLRPRRPAPIRLHRGAALIPKMLMSMAYLANRADAGGNGVR